MAFGTTTSAYEMDGVGVGPAVNNAADQISSLKGIAQANSAFNAEPLYKELTRICHPDRFAPDEEKMRIADELFQRITKNRNNIKELQNLRDEMNQKLKIKL